jgi:hypothetical protein
LYQIAFSVDNARSRKPGVLAFLAITVLLWLTLRRLSDVLLTLGCIAAERKTV